MFLLYICAICENQPLIVRFVTIFLHEILYTSLAGSNFKLHSLKIFKVCPVNFFVKIVTRGNAVQTFPNFPAKRLSI